MSQRTPFYDRHVKMGGKIVDFHGWELPVQFTTISQEHTAVREKAGLFDISHMGQVFVRGTDAEKFLQNLITNDVRKAPIGIGIYAHLLNDKGGVIDDIFVYHLEEDKFLVIINASRRAEDVPWMKVHMGNMNVSVEEATGGAGLALQGPKAVSIAAKLNPDIRALPRFGIAEFNIGKTKAWVARTGYTGEDGFEFFAPATHMVEIFDAIIPAGQDFGLLPCGLGARDTLRTEVAYPLYGHELDADHTPLEAGLSWVVKFDKGEFIGRSALDQQKASGLKTKLVGFQIESGGIARPGANILSQGKVIGTVASGTFAPSLSKAIGMAYVPVEFTKPGQKFDIQQGSRSMNAVTVTLPFLKKPVVAKK